MAISACSFVVLIAAVAFGGGQLWDHAPINPVAYSLPALPDLPASHLLSKAETWFADRVQGAEHIEFFCRPQTVASGTRDQHFDAFAGLVDGRIIKFDPDLGADGPIEILNRTSSLKRHAIIGRTRTFSSVEIWTMPTSVAARLA